MAVTMNFLKWRQRALLTSNALLLNLYSLPEDSKSNLSLVSEKKKASLRQVSIKPSNTVVRKNN